MKVLIQNPYYESGGAENRIRMLIQALVKRPEITQVHFMFQGVEPMHTEQAQGKMHMWQYQTGRTKKLTKQIIEEYDIDIVQFHNNQLIGTDGLEYAQSIGIPTVWVMHDFWPLCPQRFLTDVWKADSVEPCEIVNPYKCFECVGIYNYEIYKAQKEVINKCNVGIVPSKRIAKIFEDNDLLKGKWLITDPWINLEVFHPKGNKRKPWQVSFAGNFIPHKGINVLLRAWELVNRRIAEASLVAIGDNRCLNETIELAQSLQLKNINMVQRVEQNKLAEVFSESSITIFPSIWEETAGLTWIEALACGTPVIASRTGSIPELSEHGVKLFERGNHVELAEVIVDLLLSPSKRNTMAKEGYDYVQKYNADRAAEIFMNLYYHLEGEKFGNDNENTTEK